jgi:SAM-dependent methyltransferase
MDNLKEHLQTVRQYWDLAAARYLVLFRNELQCKPYDLEVLKLFAADLGPGAEVCDIGCGPCGHVTRLLADYGLNVRGVDLSSECVALARAEQPSLLFDVMDMGDMTFGDCVFDGLVAYYALHYQPRSTLERVFRGFWRVLRPGGRLLIVAKDGDGEGLVSDPLGSSQEVFWSALPEDDLAALLSSSGFRILSRLAREPLSGEISVRRIYVCAQRPLTIA